MMDTNKTTNWDHVKTNPVIVVISFCAVTAAAVAGIYEKLVIPNHLKIQEIKIAEITRELEQSPGNKKVIAERDRVIEERDQHIAALKRDNEALVQRVLTLSKDNVFSENDAYPRGFRQIRLGDALTKVETIYAGKGKNYADRSFYAVDPEDFFFELVYFYYGQSKPQRITDIIFRLRSDSMANPTRDLKSFTLDTLFKSTEAQGLLKAQLTERFGLGKPTKNGTVWKVKGVEVEVKEDGFEHGWFTIKRSP